MEHVVAPEKVRTGVFICAKRKTLKKCLYKSIMGLGQDSEPQHITHEKKHFN